MFCLCQPTAPTWVNLAWHNLDAILADHAHCEVKAATTALSLALKNHQDLQVVLDLSRLAEEEIDHFKRVVGFLEQRAIPLGLPPADRYAVELRKAATSLPGSPLGPVVDRLLVGAIIEARSCERFKLLLDRWPSDVERDLYDFYRELFECEARHYVTYRALATRVASTSPEVVDARLEALSRIEGDIVTRLGNELMTATVHG